MQLGVLTGVGAGLVGTVPGELGAAPMPCQLEGECTFNKPRLMFLAEYSTAMNQPFDAELTRWEAVKQTIEFVVDFDNGYVAEHYILGLARFGSDPEPMTPDTVIDGTGLVDGVALDVAWYDPEDPNKFYRECTAGDVIIEALAALPAPAMGIGAWAKGGLDFTRDTIVTANADHPQDGSRVAMVMLLSAGVWTEPSGVKKLMPATEHPKIAAAQLWVELKVPTMVVNFGGAAGKLVSDPVAQAGTTEVSWAASDVPGIIGFLKSVIVEVQKGVVAPVCDPEFPRVMFVIDGSSSMLNVDGVRAGPGLGAWDQVRAAIAGDGSVLDAPAQVNLKLEMLMRAGVTVFGSAEPAEQAVLVQYGSCAEDRIEWALDPASSCVAPGCVDPYAAPAIEWTFQDAALLDPPVFGESTISHMPRCDADPMAPGACAGSGRFVHLGLELVESNLAAHRATCMLPDAKFPCDEQTPFFNVLITDGKYDSTDEQVQSRLVAMFDAGVVTRVVGFGPDVDVAQLEAMADWGSGSMLDAGLADSQDQLEQAILGMFAPLVLDPCCSFLDCGAIDESDGPSESGEAEGTVGDESTEATSSGEVSSGSSSDSTGGSSSSSGTTETSGSSGGESGEPPTSTTVDPGVPTTSGPVDPSGMATTTDASSSSGAGPEVVGEDGCACRSGGQAHGLWLLGLLGLGRRRRRR